GTSRSTRHRPEVVNGPGTSPWLTPPTARGPSPDLRPIRFPLTRIKEASVVRAPLTMGLFRQFRRPTRFTPSLQDLEGRVVPAVSAQFSPLAGETLTIFGDGQDNVIVIGRDAAGTITVNGGAVPVLGGTPTQANTAQIRVFGLGGNDNVRLDET